MSESVIFPVYAQLNPLFHLNIVFESLLHGAIIDTKCLSCLFSTNTSTSFAVGITLSIKSVADISSTLENFLGFTATSFSISPKMSTAPTILLAASLLENKILFTVMSSKLANLLCKESIYPSSVMVFFASSSIFFV